MEKYIRPSAAFFIAFFITLATVALNPASADAATITSAPVSSITSRPLASAKALAAGTPQYLYIPSIKLLSNIQGVGVNEKGNMDVPSGKTTNVGWYKYGVAPGAVGTAVLDAHNTAAFKELSKVPVGSTFYIMDTSGTWKEFKVTKANTYSMANLSPTTLFAPTNTRQVNLITCAGTLLGNGEATHRLIVSAEMV